MEQWTENEEWNAITDISHGTWCCDVDKYILSKLLCHFFSYRLFGTKDLEEAVLISCSYPLALK